MDRGAQLVLSADEVRALPQRSCSPIGRDSFSPRAAATRSSAFSSRDSRTSRSPRSRLAWAIPFPLPTSTGETQGTWVWFDALPNYLTATGYPDAGYETRWPAQLHVIGKDITRLHAVIWPAMLEAAGVALPEQIWAHGFASFGGERFSKSAGVKLDLDATIGRYDPDAFRFFLLREVPFDADGSLSLERFDERYNADLANSFGNLASRALSMIEKYCDGVVPRGKPIDLDTADLESVREYHDAMSGERGYLLHEGLKAVMQSVARGNEFIQSSQPWAMAKDPARRAELESVMAALARHLARHAVLLFPFMPKKAAALWQNARRSGDARGPALFIDRSARRYRMAR